jgi:hypothetical protein
MNVINRENAKSKTPRTSDIAIITINTIRVIFQASGGVGQVTLRNSPTVSRQNRWILWTSVNFFFLGVTSYSSFTAKTPPKIDGAEKS